MCITASACSARRAGARAGMLGRGAPASLAACPPDPLHTPEAPLLEGRACRRLQIFQNATMEGRCFCMMTEKCC